MIRVGRVSIALSGWMVFCVAFAMLLPSAAQADCAQWDLSGHWEIRQTNGITVLMDLVQTGTDVHGAAAYGLRGGVGEFGAKVTGPVTGTVNGNSIQLTAEWNNAKGGEYTGGVGSDAFIGGSTRDQSHPEVVAGWRGNRAATCLVTAGLPSSPAGVPEGENEVLFDRPAVKDSNGQLRQLDWCRVWAAECGKPAADAFCIQADSKFAGASNFVQQGNAGADGPTWVIGSNRLCTDTHCDGFKSITCVVKKVVKLGKRKTPQPAGQTATAIDDVDIYDGPGGDNNVIGMLGAGAKAPVVEHQEGWYKLQVNVPAGTGWVAEDHLTVNP